MKEEKTVAEMAIEILIVLMVKDLAARIEEFVKECEEDERGCNNEVIS